MGRKGRKLFDLVGNWQRFGVYCEEGDSGKLSDKQQSKNVGDEFVDFKFLYFKIFYVILTSLLNSLFIYF